MCSKWIVFCLFVILVCLVSDLESLEENSEGVCVVKISIPQRRIKRYNVVINKWCGRRKCVVKKKQIETFLKWVNQTICCTGWQHNSDLDICEPICSTGCYNGTCIAPDKCLCSPPLYLDPERHNSCIQPTCKQACINSDCWGNNTCKCKPNFSPYNSTHCFQCSEGYIPDEGLNCVPVCDTPCINGTCTSPNTCTCQEGFKSVNKSTCERICKCDNGYCEGEKCVCFKGYTNKDGRTCVLNCEACSNGQCLSLNNCVCNTGYTKIDGICKPKCESCQNGECVAPNICKCNFGYADVDGICRPICENCVNGLCVAPNKCLCDDGYIEIDGICKPICENCQNGNCFTPNNCTCYNGYIKTGGICKSKCDNCENGICSAPNKCTCNSDYIKVDGLCKVRCDCVNGFCVKPNICQCFEGYQKSDVSDNICVKLCDPVCEGFCEDGRCLERNCQLPFRHRGKLVCCTRWKYNSATDSCVPICRPACKNNTVCTASNKCSCKEGYEEKNDTCTPICEGCDHGDCINPGECQCHPGYTFVNSTCEPQCMESCFNGFCSAPNTCSCNKGYQKIGDNSTECIMVGQMVDCLTCDYNCTDTECYCKNGPLCFLPPPEASETQMAGLRPIWIAGGAIALLMFVAIAIVLQRFGKKKDYVTNEDKKGGEIGSVLYPLPNTLLQQPRTNEDSDEDLTETMIRNDKGTY